MKRNSVEYFLQEINEMLAARLRTPGTIRTKEAWKLCKLQYPYSSFCQYFRIIMMRMVTRETALYISPGTWRIKTKFIHSNK